MTRNTSGREGKLSTYYNFKKSSLANDVKKKENKNKNKNKKMLEGVLPLINEIIIFLSIRRPIALSYTALLYYLLHFLCTSCSLLFYLFASTKKSPLTNYILAPRRLTKTRILLLLSRRHLRVFCES